MEDNEESSMDKVVIANPNTAKENDSIDIDDYLEKIGQCGMFQIRTQILFIFFMLPITYQVLIMYFVGKDPAWKCVKGSRKCPYLGDIKEEERDKFAFRCRLPRNEWEYSTPKGFSLVTEFDLVCDKEWIASLANAVMFIGWAIGGIGLTYLSDRYGRKCILFPAVLTMIIAAALSALVRNVWVFMVCRAIIGFAEGGGAVVIFVLATEIVGPKFRALSGTIIWFYFTAALVAMTGQAYLLMSWVQLELVCSLPFLVIIFLWRYIPESIRWLRMNNRLDQAEEILHGIAKLNKREIPSEELMQMNGKMEKVTLLAMFSKAKLAMASLIQAFSWFVSGVTFFGVSLASGDLGGDFYVNFILTSLVEVPANILLVFLTNRFGRKCTILSHLIVTGIACTCIASIPYGTTNPVIRTSKVLCGMIGKYGITLAFNGFYIWSAELHPTVVRTQAIGFLNVCSRIGGACAPFIVTSLKKIHPSVPFAIMAGLNFVASIVSMLLVETKGLPTLETMEDTLVIWGYKTKEKEDGLVK